MYHQYKRSVSARNSVNAALGMNWLPEAIDPAYCRADPDASIWGRVLGMQSGATTTT